MCSIRYFNWQKVGLLFDPINWQLTLHNVAINYMATHVTIYSYLLHSICDFNGFIERI